MMDISESTRILFDKIQKLEPEYVSKIIGYILLRDHGDEEIVRLAIAPDHLLCEMVFKAKTELQRFPNKLAMAPMTPPMDPSHILTHLPAVSPRTFSSPGSFHVPSPCRDPQLASNAYSDFIPPVYLDSIPELQNQCLLYNHMEAVKIGTSGFPNDYYYLDNAVGNLSVRGHRRLSSLPDFPAKICQYFNEGYCKHGSSCRYSHEQVIPEGFFQMYDEDQGLQADSYLADIQKHGKAGYNVTKLLASRENDIPSVDRPYGLHSLVLAEDTPKYMQYRNGKHDPCQVVSASRQIYLTFPAESTFTTEDVENYFNTFGPVEDVRIPYQQKRMFGFVTFSNANTVKTILQKGNPNFVCESRVLVKPYRKNQSLLTGNTQKFLSIQHVILHDTLTCSLSLFQCQEIMKHLIILRDST